MATANPYVGAARAAIGQGLGMGWGDEGEAWLRSKLGQGSYEDQVKQIREEYGQYAKENPYTSGALEFAGGAAPGVAAMMIPGGQAAGAAQLQRSTLGALGRLAATGAATGAVAGAGAADEDKRLSGAGVGAVAGGILGVALPTALRGTGAAGKWLRERLYPTESVVAERAAQKMTKALSQEHLSPSEITAVLSADRVMGVPSVVANANPALADLAEAVAQRTGAGARKVEKTLIDQRLGARERSYKQVDKNLKPGNYYDDLDQLNLDMKARSAPAYAQAYAYGEVKDPAVLSFLNRPQFIKGLQEAQLSADTRGVKIDLSKPTVEMLDHAKKGIDVLIEKETDALTGKMTSHGRDLVMAKKDFLKELDRVVPDYELARGIWGGGAELKSAMNKGINDFNKMDHEQVIKLVAGMNQSEKEAFRTGVARDLYSRVMDPRGNFNAAERIIGGPEMKAKLQPLFDSPGHFDLFKNALDRESQLFYQSNRVLGGSQTGKRMQMREELEGGTGVGEAIGQAVSGGFKSSLLGLAARAVRAGEMTDKTAAKLSEMLMAKDPHEVAAVVKMLEDHAAASMPKAVRASAVETGAVTGAASALAPAPSAPEPEPNIESDIASQSNVVEGPDIEADTAKMK